MKSLKRRLALISAAALTFAAAPAHADPISAAIVAAIGLSGTVAAAATFALDVVLAVGLTAVSSALFGPKAASVSQSRQADVLALAVGEAPRQVIVGRAATGGSLVDCAYYGGKYGTDWNLFAVALADHECEGIEGFYVNDTYVPWPFEEGNYGGPVPGYNGQLEVHFRPGTADAPGGPDGYVAAIPALAAGMLKGVCHVMYAYAADPSDAANPVWSGRPSFLWVIKGAKVYDPRLDSSVEGGSGDQRWENPATWTWSENAALCEYAYQRGVYALNQVDQPGMLLVGRGLSALEAPPERVIAAANLCDEEVAAANGTEPRYRVGGVIQSSDTFQDVAQMFADATAGVVTQPEGAVFVQPGQAQTPVVTITDDDLLIGQSTKLQGFASDSDRVNTVIARYIEPAQKWAETSAPVSRDLADLVTDGGPRELTLSLPLVPYVGQAQRVADIRRRKARLERTGSVVLGPRFADLEEGDWIGWTSQRRFGGGTVYFRVTAYSLDQAWQNTLALEEIDFDVFGFGGAGATPTGPEPVTPPGALELDGVQIVATHLQGTPASEGATAPIVPAVDATWTTPVDPAISTVRLEVRVGADGAVTPTSTTAVSKGELLTTAGVVSNRTDLQARLVPLGDPSRPVTPSPWVTLSTGDLVATTAVNIAGHDIEELVEQLNAAAATAEAALDATGYGPAQNALTLILKTVSDADNAIVNDFLNRSPATGQVLNLVVDGHTEVLDDHTVYFRALGRATGDGRGFILDMDTVEVDPDGTTLTGRVSDISAATGADVLGQVQDKYVANTTLTQALAAQNETITAQYQSFTATSLQSYITYADATQAIAVAQQETLATTGSLISEATFQLASQTDLSQAISGYDLTIKAFIDGGVGATVQQQAGVLATLQGKTLAFFQETVTGPDGVARFRMVSGDGSTSARLEADNIWFGDNVEVEPATSTQHWFAGSVQNVMGAGFGAAVNLLEWFGPSNVATAQMTTANAYVWKTTDGKMGGPGLPSGGGSSFPTVVKQGDPIINANQTLTIEIDTGATSGVIFAGMTLFDATAAVSGTYAITINGAQRLQGTWTSQGTENNGGQYPYEVIQGAAGTSVSAFTNVSGGKVIVEFSASGGATTMRCDLNATFVPSTS